MAPTSFARTQDPHPGAPRAAEEPSTRQRAAAAWSEDGLQRLDVRGLDLVYARPGSTLAPYRRIWLRPVQVSFQRDWARAQQRDTGQRVRPRDLQRIRAELAAEVELEVRRELERGGYALVGEPGEDVLELEVRATELYLNAADLPGAADVRSYTMSFGRMTLVADLRDSVTGDSVMRILDRRIGRDYGLLRYTTRVENTREVGIAAQDWARALRRQLALAGARPGR
jgi:hypothetical protein